MDVQSSSFTVRSSFVLILLLLLQSCSVTAICDQQDHDSLYPFFANVSASLPLNWSSSSMDCCLWEGVECGGSDSRVVRLSLPSRGLAGIFSPSLANLTSLRHLNLSHNRLSGPVPAGLFSLSRLQIIDLSYNRLNGELPDSSIDIDESAMETQIVDLSSNFFKGVLPSNSFLQVAGNLSRFNVSNNSFTGEIPLNICLRSSRSLTVLDFSNNDFSGNIPSGIGQCSNLRIFSAGFNNLSGTIPEDIYEAVLLERLSLPVNRLSGSISDALVNLNQLRILDLFSNKLIGRIPEGIGNLSNLEQLQLHINNLTGQIPPSLVKCTKLVTLNLRVNFLVGELSSCDFSKFLQLSILDLGNNNFTGTLPASLYSCKSLKAVRLAFNRLTGQFSPEIQALESLSFLSVSSNNLTNLTGAIRIMMGCKNLTTLILSVNFINETIPDDENIRNLDGFQNLQVLALGASNLSGQVPTWLAKLKNLEVLDLSVNRITGSIPSWLGGLQSLFYIDLSRNFLSGELPKELGALYTLALQGANELIDRSYLPLPVFAQPNNATYQQYNQLSSLPPAIYMGYNNLSGDIPPELGKLKFLHVLDLRNNKFVGSIPDQISKLTNLEQLDLSENRLSGEIPASLKALNFLSSFNVANNSLHGPIPTGGQFDTFPISSFSGNPGLCGPILQRSCSNSSGPSDPTTSHNSKNIKLILGMVIGICFGTGLLAAVLALWILSNRRVNPRGDSDDFPMDTFSSSSYSVFPQADKDTSLVLLFSNNTDEIKDLTISELLKATDNFDQENIVGCGGFGLVYKATMPNGTKLAVKKLSAEMGIMEREFKAEVEALSTAKHENLVSLQGYCVYAGSRLLIYSYIENGSLDYWLHEKPDGPSQLDWPTRSKIVHGASKGLAYMHQTCEPHIVHRDIKSSNILLDDKFKAYVADFGLARLILPYQTHVTTELVGTLGYIPPEYGQSWVATLRGDIYSFGVVMLELLTGKRPVEVFNKSKTTRELIGWVQQMRNEGKQDEIFDPHLRGKGFEDEMLKVLDVACMCVNKNPLKRPTIKDIVGWLENLGSDRNQKQELELQYM